MEALRTALTATTQLSSASEYSIYLWIFSKVSGCRGSGKNPSAPEKLPTLRVVSDRMPTIATIKGPTRHRGYLCTLDVQHPACHLDKG